MILPTVYAAKDAQGGIMVTEPLCNDDFWTNATRHVQMLAMAMVKRMYLRSLASNKLLLRSGSGDW